MTKLLKTFVVALAICMLAASPSYAWFLDFEFGLGQDGSVITTGIPGLQFSNTAGFDWTYGDANSNNYNVQNQFAETWNGAYFYMEDYVFAWLGPSQGSGRIDFLGGDGSYFTTGYCSASDFYLEAYDADDNLIDMAQGPSNYTLDDQTPGAGLDYLTVNSGSNNIAYVLVHDTGNQWLIDNVSGDASGVTPPGVPEPTTILLLGSGLLGLGVIRRKKQQ